MKYSLTTVRQLEAEQAEATKIVEQLSGIALARQTKFDELWELERQGAELRTKLLGCYRHIDILLTSRVKS